MKRQTIIGICSLLLLCGWFASAADNGDCWLVTNTGDVSKFEVYQKFTENFKGTNIEGVMPAKAISQALVNLKKACCMSQEMSNKETYCKGYINSEKYPNSLFLYDQLLDIWLRRLDGNTDLAYGVEPDPKGLERREFITNAAEDKDGAVTAKTVLEKRDTDRTRKKIYTDNRTEIQFKDTIQNYGEQTLADKYYNTCNVVGYVYEQLRADETKTIDITTCQSLINKRIADESTYTRVVMIKKSNELLHNTIQAYMQKYFIEDKMMTLMVLINKVKSLFSTMVQQAPTLQKCTQ